MKKASGKTNIQIVKDYLNNERPFTQTGWTPDMKKRSEGEIWKDSHGQSWTIKLGKKIAINNISKNVGLIKEKCKKCKLDINLFGNKLDKKIYRKTGMCFDCNLKFESELRKKGEYEIYEKLKIFNNQKSYCLDIKQKLEESIEYLEKKDNKIRQVLEDGTELVWDDTMREKILIDVKKDYKECLESLKRINKQLEFLNGNRTK